MTHKNNSKFNCIPIGTKMYTCMYNIHEYHLSNSRDSRGK